MTCNGKICKKKKFDGKFVVSVLVVSIANELNLSDSNYVQTVCVCKTTVLSCAITNKTRRSIVRATIEDSNFIEKIYLMQLNVERRRRRRGRFDERFSKMDGEKMICILHSKRRATLEPSHAINLCVVSLSCC